MKIPGFDILEKITEDRLTVVWKANQNSLNRTVAIKILRPEFASHQPDVEQFLAEGRTIGKLKHPGIIQVYDVIEQSGAYFFVMEDVAGATLAQKLDGGEKIGQKKALKWAAQVADALDYAWKTSHLIHRNLKPENIYLDDDGTVKVALFGLSKVASPLDKDGAEQEESKTIAGTPYYMSPEQAQCSPNLDCRSDMYSLGAVLYQVLTGKMPFQEHDPMTAADKQITDQIDHPKDLNPTLAPGVISLITRLMMKDRKDRPRNWEEVIQDLTKLAAGQLVLKKPDPAARSTVGPEAKPIASTPDPGSRPALARKPSLYIPIWVQLPAWALLLVWWYLLARLMLDYWAHG